MVSADESARFVHVSLDLTCLASGGAVFEAPKRDDETRGIDLHVPEARWREWGRPVEIELTIDTEAGEQ